MKITAYPVSTGHRLTMRCREPSPTIVIICSGSLIASVADGRLQPDLLLPVFAANRSFQDDG
jgi:hypothetical protein